MILGQTKSMRIYDLMTNVCLLDCLTPFRPLLFVMTVKPCRCHTSLADANGNFIGHFFFRHKQTKSALPPRRLWEATMNLAAFLFHIRVSWSQKTCVLTFY